MNVDHLVLLLLAFVLSTVIGLEREFRQKHAGLRTHTLVGTGAALFMLVSKFGFEDIVSGGTVDLDPSRVAAQVVSGIGFIGAGVIFLRRDGVKGLTTAAAIWLTAAVGLAAGTGLVWLAVAATTLHLATSFLYTPIVRRMPSSRLANHAVVVHYRDREGVLRNALATATGMDYLISDLEVERTAQGGSVSVSFDVEGPRRPEELARALGALDGVLDVRVGDVSP